jgi:crotonobetainyl-CoA:carnitine CoA-transferase CaiB-like acyl-CoA transferase
VAIQAFRPDVARRFGLTEEVLRERHPHLLLCSITAFDPEGTRAHRPGYDPLLQAHTGIMSVTGPAGGGPVRVGTSIMDLGAGMWAAIGVLSALRRRDRGGSGPGGGHVRVSLEDVGIAWSAYHLMGVEATGRVPGPMGTGLGMIAPYGAFPTLDGALLIAAGNDVLFQRLCAAMDLDELGSDPRLRTNPDRVAHRELLEKALADATRGYTTAELEARLEGRGVPCAAIRDMGEVARDPEVRRGAFRAEEHPRIPGYRAVAPPPVFDGKRLPPPPPPPAPGEHSEAILEELGFTPSRIRALKEEGAVGPGPGDPTMSER